MSFCVCDCFSTLQLITFQLRCDACEIFAHVTVSLMYTTTGSHVSTSSKVIAGYVAVAGIHPPRTSISGSLKSM